MEKYIALLRKNAASAGQLRAHFTSLNLHVKIQGDLSANSDQIRRACCVMLPSQ
jgi:hypothetical protein